MKLYHGSLVAVEKPLILLQKNGLILLFQTDVIKIFHMIMI